MFTERGHTVFQSFSLAESGWKLDFESACAPVNIPFVDKNSLCQALLIISITGLFTKQGQAAYQSYYLNQ